MRVRHLQGRFSKTSESYFTRFSIVGNWFVVPVLIQTGFTLSTIAADPIVSNVRVSQRRGTKSDPDSGSLTVAVAILTDGHKGVGF